MTPEERKLVTDLFDRLATLEDAERDPDAANAINQGLKQAPNALYALVQTALVQDEALKRADARIRELEAELGTGTETPPRQGGFLDNMRGALFGRQDAPRAGSVPSVRPGDATMSGPAGYGADTPTGGPGGYGAGTPTGGPAGYGAGSPMGAPGGYGAGGPFGAQPGGRGGSFLGTAAASAAGVIGGAMMLDGIRSMMGHGGGAAHGLAGINPAGAATADSSPWGGGGSGSGNLGRDAGLDDIGRSASSGGATGDAQSRGLFGGDSAAGDDHEALADDAGANDLSDDDTDFGDDNGGDFGGDDGDTA